MTPIDRFGRVASHDEEDMRFPLRALLAPAATIVIPNLLSLPVSFVGDQQGPHCVGYAWTGFLRVTPRRNARIDPVVLYRGAQHHDEWHGENYNGTSVRGGAKYLVEEDKVPDIQEYRWGKDHQDAIDWIAAKRTPLVAGSDWLVGMEAPDSNGFVRATGDLVGGHAWLVYGYNKRMGYLRAVNSWGLGWGLRGRFKITFADFDKLMERDGELCVATKTATR